MASLRRLYAYSAALAALEAWVWGMVSLLTKALRGVLWSSPESLAGALAAVLIGLPVFAFHWRWVQSDAARREEERRAAVRAGALYVALALAWAPAFQAAAALLARGLQQVLPVPEGTLLSPAISGTRAAAVLLVHCAIGVYFSWVLREDTRAGLTDEQAIARRWYRYWWLSYGIVWLWLGVRAFLSVFAPPDGFLTPLELNKFVFVAQGIVFAAGGLSITAGWGMRWWQESLTEPRDRRSAVIAGFLVVWTVGGLAFAVATTGVAVQRVLRVLLGDALRFYPPVRTALIAGVPSLALWLVAQRALARFVAGWEAPRRAGLYRLVLTLIALAGLFVLTGGVMALVNYVSGVWFGTLSDHSSVAAGLTWTVLGLALWGLPWHALQVEAAEVEETRRTLLRRAYLYFVLFVALLGAMGFATAMTFEVLRAWLGGTFHGRGFVFAAGMALWTVGVLVYHARVVWEDRRADVAHSGERAQVFRVLALAASPEAPWVSALQAEAGGLEVEVHTVADAPPEEGAYGAVVLDEAALLALPLAWQRWLAAFEGDRLVLTTEDSRWLWLENAQPRSAVPKALRDLAAGKRPKYGRPRGVWLALAYLGIFSLVSWVLGIILPLVLGLLFSGGMH